MKRTLIAAVAALSLLPGACSDGSGVGSGRTQVVLTDAPFPYDDVSHVNLYISHVDASTSADTIPGDQQWVTVASPEQLFDVLALQNGSTALLGDVDLPAGQYRAIRMVIDPSRSSIVLTDGSQAIVHWPYAGPDGLSTLYAIVEEPFEPGLGARIVIDFDVGRSFIVLESMPRQFVLIPWLRAVNDAATGHLRGRVFAGTSIDSGGVTAAGAAVTVLKGNPQLSSFSWYVAATGRVDAQGNYAINYLRDGDYIVRFEENVGMLTVVPGCIEFSGVTVNRRETTTLNAVISRSTDLCAAHSPNDTSGQGPDTSFVPPGGPVASVTVHVWTPPAGLVVGDSVPAVAELRNAAGGILSGRTVTWSLSDSSVVRLDGLFGPYAHLRALTAGSVTLSATSEGRTGSVNLTVGSGSVGTGPVATVQLLPQTTTVHVNDSLGITAILRDASGGLLGARAVTWSVADTTVFRVTSAIGNAAVLRGLRVGQTMVTATSEGRSGSASLTVAADTTTTGGGAVAFVTVTPATISAAVGDSIGAYASLTNASGAPLTGRVVSFSVSDSTVARITGLFGQSVLLRALKAGNATLTALSEGKSGTASITVH